ncbi:flagellar hook-basal body protein [Occallatibacter savannae]|uniref:flagellar hook-basal body protein n=1 Tax=Occallatibacter savannae TaxID=1002691 RepID=UPI000D69661A|nr:flagellar hook basal-body protein [Occallatibacter savannae]
MDSGYYAAVSGWVARAQALDQAAANLANARTPGFRAEREYFRSYLAEQREPSQVGQAVNEFGLLGGSQLSGAQGPMQHTGNPLDLAIEGDGFFAVQTANGLRFTRDGSFHRSQAGLLVTAAGEPVLSHSKQSIPTPPGQISVGADGALSVDGAVFASVGVFGFPQGTQSFKAEGANRYAAPEGASIGAPKAYVIRQGELEGANQDAIQGSLDLLVMQRQAEMMQKALMVFHTEFNKTATEDLPKV